MSERDDLRPEETELLGQWLDVGSRIEPDAVSERIAWLVSERLQRVGGDAGDASDGREAGRAVYRDPRDGRVWELTHPYEDLPAGGPPRLAVRPRPLDR